eukprot:CAMPEP_0114525886 /NCGR_PEP_ID=MMETSP0109-20121206/22686_1 /TAXON_ID=29199 /ORGANISM="Chlorarachnion reptans, Strain CCCM449" /LENGTH=56 /DNA_ID=CAMNT_0001707543 /DNA_START=13 /DNA_END=179 /DNA_ORIENTATION=+
MTVGFCAPAYPSGETPKSRPGSPEIKETRKPGGNPAQEIGKSGKCTPVVPRRSPCR